MNKKCMTLIVSALVSLAMPNISHAQGNRAASVGNMDLDLKKAIEIALAENPTIKVADKDIQLKEIADKEAWQALLPSVSASLSLSHSIQVAAIKTAMGEFKMGSDGTTTATGGLTMTLPIYAPAVYQNMKLTKEDILLAQEKARSSRLDLINQVTKAYYAALLSKDSRDVIKRSYNVAKENYDVVDKKFQVGKVSEYDKITAEVQMRSMGSSVTSAETGLNFTLLATPAEGLSGRFVKIDREKYGKIEGVTDRNYYTNSFHVPVYYPIGAFEKLDIEAPYHDLTNAGHISYVELDGDTAKNPEAFESVIRHMQKVGVGYGSVNHPVDRDPVCGYTGVIDDVCPRCGRREGEPVTIERLNELRMKFPSVPVPCDCTH